MSVSYAEFRSVVFDAAKGLDALTTYIETRLEIADHMESEGLEEAATEVRAVWTRVWEVINGAPRRALLSELHEMMDPVSFDEQGGYDEDEYEEVPEDDGREGSWIPRLL